MAGRTRRAPQGDEIVNPIDETMFLDAQGIAGDLGEILDALSGFDSGAIKAILYRKPSNGIGKYEIIEECPLPIDMSAIVSDLKERFGGGSYQLRIMAQGRVRKNIDFDIVKEKTPAVQQKNDSMGEMFPLLITMMNGSADRQMQMMMQMSQQTQAMFAQMNQSQTAMMTALVPAMMGNREKASDIIAMVSALKGDDKGGMAGIVETIKAVREILPGSEGGGFDPEGSLIENGLKLAGPVLGALSRNLEARRDAAPQGFAPPAPVHVAPRIAAPVAVEPAHVISVAEPVAPVEPHPLIAEIADDVLAHFKKRRDPDFAAEMVYDLIAERPNLGAEIDELVAAFTVSTDWLSDLAAQGLDLRAAPEWANAFLQGLIGQHAGIDGDDDAPERGSGGVGDLAGHAAVVAAGIADNAHSGEGG